MRLLVTGAAGFLGRHVVRRLLADGLDVTTYDLVDTGHLDARSITGDLRDADKLSTAAMGHEAICHVGAIGDVYLAAEKPHLAADINVTGSANVAAAAHKAGARVIYASTWEVYGKPRYRPLDEEHPCDPDHPYNITKLAGERLLLAADRLRGVPVLALRLGTAYGTGLRANSVFRIFIDRARRGDPIVIQGDGAQTRQFTHAADIAKAFSLASQTQAHGVALNTLASESTTIRQLAERVVARFPTDLTFGDSRPGDVPSAEVAVDRIAQVLGWRAEIPFDRGLSELMDAIEAEG